jgi:hypothetical protein
VGILRVNLALLIGLCLPACFNAEIGVNVQCGPGDGCPTGFECNADKVCVPLSGDVIDAAGIDAIVLTIDAGGQDAAPADAFVPDADIPPDAYVPQSETLTQSNSLENATDLTLACRAAADNDENRPFQLLRKFDLSNRTRTTQIDVFSTGVLLATAPVEQSVTANLYTMDDPGGALVYDNLTVIDTATVAVADHALPAEPEEFFLDIDMNAQVPAGSVLVAELVVPTGEGTTNVFRAGFNQLGEVPAISTYFAATTCGYAEPTPATQVADDLGAPDIEPMWVMKLEGEY